MENKEEMGSGNWFHDLVYRKINDYIHQEAINREAEIAAAFLDKLGMTQQDLINESNRRFCRIKIEKHPDATEYWYDDGSKDGMLVISFEDSNFIN